MDQSCVILAVLLFQVANRAATTRRNTLGLMKLSDGLCFSFLAAKECGFFMIPNARDVLPLVLLLLGGALPWPTTATSSCRGRNAIFISRSITFSVVRAKPGTNALKSQPPWGMRGFISERNVLSWLAYQTVPCALLAEGFPLPSWGRRGPAQCCCWNRSWNSTLPLPVVLFSDASCCTQSACWVFRCPTPSSGFRRSWRTRSNRMLTFRCGGKKRRSQI